MADSLPTLLNEVRACRLCEPHLPLGANPVLQAGDNVRLLIISQAPGKKVHTTGIPWNDPSGDRLRQWLQIDKATFYNPDKVAIIPMGFCYPGKGKSGDLPPRKECAPTWHARLFAALPHVELTLLIGQYAQRYYLSQWQGSVTANVQHYRDYLPKVLPLPHPSPRNIGWLKRNPWFETDLLPVLRARVNSVLR